MDLIKYPYVFFAVCIASNLLYGQYTATGTHKDHEAGLPFAQTFTPQDYKGNQQVWGTVQDSKGLMYFANHQYILIYDGTNWTSLKMPNLMAAKSIAVDDKDRIFVGGTQDLGYLAPDSLGQLQYVSLLPKLDSSIVVRTVWEVHATPMGVLFNTGDQLLLWNEDHFQSWAFNDGPVSVSTWARDTIFFLQDKVGLQFITKNQAPSLLQGGAQLANDQIYTITAMLDESLLIGTRNKGFVSYHNGHASILNSTTGIQNKRLYCETVLNNGTYAFGTLTDGLVVMDAKGALQFKLNNKEILPSIAILSLYQSKDNILWLCTNDGIAKLEYPSPYTIYDKNLGIPSAINKVVRYKDRLIAGTHEGLFVLNNEANSGQFSFSLFHNVRDKVWDLHVVQDQLLLALETGIYYLENNTIKQISTAQPSSLYRSKIDTNRIFVPFAKGLRSIYSNNKTWIDEGPMAGIDGATYSMLEIASGNLMVNSYGKFITKVIFQDIDKAKSLTDPKVEIIDQSKGFPNDNGDIYTFENQIYLVSYATKKVYQYHEKTDSFIIDNSLNELLKISPAINLDQIQPNGNVWFRIYPDSTDHERPRHMVGKPDADGQYSTESVQIERILDQIGPPKLIEDSILWHYWTKPILTRHDLSQNYSQEFDRTIIRSVTYGSDSIVYGGFFNQKNKEPFDYAENQFRFTFALPNYIAEFHPEYQYHLEGYQSDWSEWTEESQKDFTNLREGTYTFHVRARNLLREICTEDSFSFVVSPPWHRSTLAYLLYLLSGVFAMGGLVRWRSSQLKRDKRVLQEVVKSRTAALQLSNEKLQKQKSKLSQQAQELQEMDAFKSRIFANISHEFRTPLTLIKGPLDQANRDPEQSLNEAHLLMMQRNTDRLLRLVNQLLDLSKLDADSIPINLAEGNLFQNLRAMASTFSSTAAERNLDYQIQIPARTQWASFDRDKLEKIVLNLLSNAFKFTPDTGQICIQSYLESQQLHIEVTDTGKGIRSKDLKKVFERFFQSDLVNSEQFEGTGIGLSLVKELVGLMDGTIHVDSTFGVGSTFYVILPINLLADPGNKSRQLINDLTNKLPLEALRQTKELPMASTNLTEILVVEDNPDMRHFIIETLSTNYRAIEAHNGQDGLQKAIEILPDLVITDLMMPEMDGLQLCELLKSDERTSHIPVIILTAKAGIENRLQGLELGADSYLTKPFDDRELGVQVKNLIAQRVTLRKVFSTIDQFRPQELNLPTLDQEFLQKTLDLFEKEFANAEFGIPAMQIALAMSKTQLHRKIKALTNYAPGEFLRNFRMKRAAQILELGENVTQTAYSVGFNNLSYFAKCFKEVHGKTPKEYAKSRISD